MSDRALDLLLTAVWLVLAGLLVLWVAQQAGGETGPRGDIIFEGGPSGAPQELVRIKPDGRVLFGPDYTPEAAERVFWLALGRGLHDRHACFARLRRERERKGAMDGGGGGRKPATGGTAGGRF